MCGGCGGAPLDPEGALVAGPRGRAAAAAAAQELAPALRVRAVPGGWTVATRTGRTRVLRTLAELVAAVAVPDARPAVRARLLQAAEGARSAAPG
jgi:hypothetical protein